MNPPGNSIPQPQQPQPQAQRRSCLIIRRPLEPFDELEAKWSDCMTEVMRTLIEVSEDEAHNALQKKVFQNNALHKAVNRGLLFGLLADSSISEKFFKLLCSISRDGCATAITLLQELIDTKYSKLMDTPRLQLLWVVKQFIASRIQGVENLCISIYRNIRGGDISSDNIWLAGQMAEIIGSNLDWVFQNLLLLQYAFYSTLRLVIDHTAPTYAALKKREIDICCAMWKEKSEACLQLGKDMVRMFHEARKIPELGEVWSKFAAEYPQLLAKAMSTRTPRDFLTSRVTDDMAMQLKFVMKEVKLGGQERYLQWFNQRHLGTQQSMSLIPDLIRFVCCTIHPSNQDLASGMTPRYVVLGSLLQLIIYKTTQTQNQEFLQNSLIALYYDWFFTDNRPESIMDIEPGALLLVKSLPRYSAISTRIMEFLLKTTDEYWPEYSAQIRSNINDSLQMILHYRVVQSYSIITNSQVLDQGLVKRFCSSFTKVSETSSSKQTSAQPSPQVSPQSSPQASPQNLPIALVAPQVPPSQTQPKISPVHSPVSSPPYPNKLPMQTQSPSYTAQSGSTLPSPIESTNDIIQDTKSDRGALSPNKSTENSVPISPNSAADSASSSVKKGSNSPAHIPITTTTSSSSFLSPSQSMAISSPTSEEPVSSNAQQVISPTLFHRFKRDLDSSTPKQKGLDISTLFGDSIAGLSTVITSKTKFIVKFNLTTICDVLMELVEKNSNEEVTSITRELATLLWSYMTPTLPELHPSLLSIDYLGEPSIQYENLLYSLFSLFLKNDKEPGSSVQYNNPVWKILIQLNEFDASIRPRLLCWLFQNKPPTVKTHPFMSPYIGLLAEYPDSARNDLFANDLEVVFDRCPTLFSTLVDRCVSEMIEFVTGSSLIIRMICLACDPQLPILKMKMAMNEITLIGASFKTVAYDSLGWEVYAQNVFWELVRCELSDQTSLTSQIYDFLLSLRQEEKTSATLSRISLVLRDRIPQRAQIHQILSMDTAAVNFAGYLLYSWAHTNPAITHETEAAIKDILGRYLSSKANIESAVACLRNLNHLKDHLKKKSEYVLLSKFLSPDISQIVRQTQESNPGTFAFADALSSDPSLEIDDFFDDTLSSPEESPSKSPEPTLKRLKRSC